MPIKSAFRRSLLNSQPIVKTISGIVSTPYRPDDGYTGVNCGFTELIERQDGIEIERSSVEFSDAVPIDSSKEIDSIHNISRKKPEIIFAMQPSVEISKQENEYRRFSTIIEESDYRQFYSDVLNSNNPSLSQEVLNRFRKSEEEIKKIESFLDELSNLIESKDKLYKDISFAKNKNKINNIAGSFRKNYYKTYSEDPQGNNIDLSSSLLGFENFSKVTNSSILYSLCLLAALPGMTILETGAGNASVASYKKMDAIKIKQDEVNDLLQYIAIASKITDSLNFLEIQKRLPDDKISRLILLAEAFSYELTTTKGLNSINRSNIFDLIKEELGTVNTSLLESSTSNSIVQKLVNNNVATLEPEQNEISSTVRLQGFVQSLIEPKIKDSTFDFSKLSAIVDDNTGKLNSYIELIKKIRLLEEDNFFSSQNLISLVCSGILNALGNWDNKNSLIKNDAQFALLCAVAKDTRDEAIKSRRLIFKEIFGVNDEQVSDYDASLLRDKILKPSKLEDFSVQEEVVNISTDIGTSKAIINFFGINEKKIKDFGSDFFTSEKLFDVSFHDDYKNRKKDTAEEHRRILTEQSLKISNVLNSETTATAKASLNASKLNGTSLLPQGINAYYRIRNSIDESRIEASDVYGERIIYVDVSNLKTKFSKIKLDSFALASYSKQNSSFNNSTYPTSQKSISGLLESIFRAEFFASSPNTFDTLAYEFEINDDSVKEILKDNDGFSSIKKEMSSLYSSIYDNLSYRPGMKTKNFKLSDDKIKFFVFELFMSVLSMMSAPSVVLDKMTVSNPVMANIDVGILETTVQVGYEKEVVDSFKVRINKRTIANEISDLKKLARRKGQESNISNGLITKLKDVSTAIGTCSQSSDLVANRVSQLQAISQVYSNSIGDFLKIASKKDVYATINNISGESNIFSNLNKEIISAKKLARFKIMSQPISLNVMNRINRVHSYYADMFEETLKDNNASVLAVGIPCSSIEFLRTGIKKEYLEINVSKRNTLYPGSTIKDTVVRFCPYVTVIPQISKSNNLLSIAHEFLYLCYENGEWIPKNILNTVKFVMKMTGLGYADSKIILINHIFDAMAKYHVYNKSGIYVDDLLYNHEYIKISYEGKKFFDLLTSDQKSYVLGALNINDVLEDAGDGYYLKKFSQLGMNAIDKTDQPTHRLLNSIMFDSMFCAESIKKSIFSSQPFERIYCLCLADSDLLDFDDGIKNRNNSIEEVSVTTKLVSN